ncbi:MAG: hypothetical protein ABI207_09140, partial [Crocinitomicaceae bacterium]
MKNLKFVGALIMLVVFTSCDKNQTAVRKLDGKWQVTETTASNGASSTTTTYASGNASTYTFDNCKLKKDEYCNVSISQIIFGVGVSLTQQYRITDDGKTLEFKNGSYSSSMTIVDLKSKDLTLKAT